MVSEISIDSQKSPGYDRKLFSLCAMSVVSSGVPTVAQTAVQNPGKRQSPVMHTNGIF